MKITGNKNSAKIDNYAVSAYRLIEIRLLCFVRLIACSGFATIALTAACSNDGCSCPSNWSKATYSNDIICYRRFSQMSYDNARATCLEYNASFPRVDGDSDMINVEELNTR